jgi:uncharacterized protein YqgC (DUF456 family)
VEVLLLSIGSLLLATGLVGCVLPVLPGPPLSFAGLLLQWAAFDFQADTYGGITILVLGALSILVTVLDFVAPAWGAKRYGASKVGVWGSVLGMLIGFVFFPPFGMLVGAFLGALGAEFVAGKAENDAMRAAWGVFIGTMAGVAMKLAVSVATVLVFVRELFA